MAEPDYKALVPSELSDLIPQFLAHRREDLEALETAFSKRDFEHLHRLAVRMKAVGAPYGFHAISELGKKISQALERPGSNELPTLIAEYRRYLQYVRVVIVAR